MEPWEKVLVEAETFPESVHGKIACTECHGGKQAADKETAHTGLMAHPSTDPTACATCHPSEAQTYAESLHATQQGYWTVLNARGLPQDHPGGQEMFGNHCASCHTSCGDCHVSQPRSAGGGFIEGHLFKASPSMTRNCTACHGSRVGNEYMGKHDGLKADIHFRQGRMKCTDCHSGADLHGQTESTASAEHRYEGAQLPSCETCHAQVGKADDPIQMHTIHGSKLSCQVCHSVSYTSCDGCHVAISDKTGSPFFSTEGSYLTFLIGRNPLQSEERPYEFVPLRHVPVSPTSFEYYGENLLPDFDALPTWAYATPHNIQRQTPQNESCEACHGNNEIFLTEDKVTEAERIANQAVVLPGAPPVGGGLPEEGEAEGEQGVAGIPAMPENHFGLTACVACHTVISPPEYPESHAEFTDAMCANCHTEPVAP